MNKKNFEKFLGLLALKAASENISFEQMNKAVEKIDVDNEQELKIFLQKVFER